LRGKPRRGAPARRQRAVRVRLRAKQGARAAALQLGGAARRGAGPRRGAMNTRAAPRDLRSGWVSETKSWSESKAARPVSGGGASGAGLGSGASSGAGAGAGLGLGSAGSSGGSGSGSSRMPPKATLVGAAARPTRSPPPAPLSQPMSYSSLGSSATQGSYASLYSSSPLSAAAAQQPRYSSPGGASRSPATITSPGSLSSVSSAGSSGVRSALANKAARTKSGSGFAQQRKELDELMDIVLRLQDEGRFHEAMPYMKRVEALQRQIEGGFEEEYVAKTGAKPQVAAPMVRNAARRARVPAVAVASAAAAAAGATAGSAAVTAATADAPTPAPALASASVPAATSATSAAPVTALPPPPPAAASSAPVPYMYVAPAAGAGAEAGQDDGEGDTSSTDGDTSGEGDRGAPFTSEDSMGSSESPPHSGKSGGVGGFFSSMFSSGKKKSAESTGSALSVEQQQQAQEQGGAGGNPRDNLRFRRLSLTGRNISDCLMLVGGEEEQEIIRTLQSDMGGSSGSGSTKSSAQPVGVFVQRATTAPAAAATPQAQAQARERFHLSKQGYMYKAPPENKRFSRWHNRYFFLAGPLLSYRKSPDAQTSRMINLKGATAEAAQVESSSRRKGSKTVYEVRVRMAGSKRVYRLRPKTKRLAYEWYVAILNNIKVADREMDTTSSERRKKEKQATAERATTAQSASWVPDVAVHTGKDVSMRPGAEAEESVNLHYASLGVQPSASGTVIKKRYRELARNYHPDKSGVIDVSRFVEIAAAYDVLIDAELRKNYDMMERVKTLFRRGIVAVQHEPGGKEPRGVVMFMDKEFTMLFWQDKHLGATLHESHKYVMVRFMSELLAGSDGYDCPPGLADCCIAIQGSRLGCTVKGAPEGKVYSIDLQLDSKAARDDLLDGLRLLRCKGSELFKQRLEQMKEAGMR
jgi:hypothetical protein